MQNQRKKQQSVQGTIGQKQTEQQINNKVTTQSSKLPELKSESRSKQQKKHKNKDHKSHRQHKEKDHREKDHKEKRRRSRQTTQQLRSRSRSRSKELRSNRSNRGHRQYRDNRYSDNFRRDHQYGFRNKQMSKPVQKIGQKIDRKVTSVLTSAAPTEIPMPQIIGEKRKRERSRSPLNYYRRNQNNNEGQFWDSFSWVPRMNYTPTVSTSALANTKKMRRLMITNVPYEMGITQDDLRNLITRFMAKNYLKDQMNSCPVVNMQINDLERNVAVELSSVEETCRICKLEKIELLSGHISGIIRLGDSCYGNNVITQAQTAGQAQAAAFAAINVLQNKKTTFSVDSLKLGVNTSSTLLRVVNAVTEYMATQLSKQQWKEYQQDLLEGFSQFGKIVHHWFVKKDEKDICADVGNLFVEYETKEEAEKAMGEMNGRIYDERTITMYNMPREVYYKNFKKEMPLPSIPNKK